MICPRCGQPGTAGQYCGRCGLHLVGSTGPVRLDKPTQQFGAPPTGPVSSYPPPDPATRYAMPGPAGAVGGPPRRPGGGRVVVLVAVVALLVLAGGAAAFLTFRGSGGETTGSVAAPAPVTTATPDPTTSATKAAVGGAAPSTVVLTTTVTPTVSATGLSDVQAQPIACQSGYFVQLASESDQGSFVRRVDQVRAAGQLPAGSRWAETGNSCAVFTAQQNTWVLYAGPFPTAADSCAARLAGPWDALIKSTTPGDQQVPSCICPAAPSALPVLYAGAPPGAWTGELQRLLGARLGYDVRDINADPSTGFAGAWGVFTADTADAVRRFQADRGLTVDGEVGAQTWTDLRSAGC